mgnify:CR=1 FL=1
MKTALLFGSSGLIGGHLLNQLIQNNNYSKIKIFVRSELEINNPKVEIIKIDFNSANTFLEITQEIFKAIAAFVKTNNIADAGVAFQEIEEIYPMQPTLGPNWMEGQILFIDQFENVVVNIRKEEFDIQAQGRTFKIVFTRNETITDLSKHYGEVPISDKLAWFNSAGYLEIAVRGGNMAGLFGLSKFDENQMNKQRPNDNKWFFQMVRVFFE